MANKEVDEFLNQFSESQRAELARIRHIVEQTVPDAQELISYGIPSFKYKGKYLVGYCAYKKHLSLFPGGAPLELLREKLRDFKLSAGTVQFTLERPIPEAVIRELIEIRARAIDETTSKRRK